LSFAYYSDNLRETLDSSDLSLVFGKQRSLKIMRKSRSMAFCLQAPHATQ
jgi:hypothetical protein